MTCSRSKRACSSRANLEKQRKKPKGGKRSENEHVSCAVITWQDTLFVQQIGEALGFFLLFLLGQRPEKGWPSLKGTRPGERTNAKSQA
jgi:hypothetical protein